MTDREAIEIVLGSDYNYDETIGYQLTSDDFEWMEMAKVALQERIDREKGGGGRVDHECSLSRM